MRQLEKYKNLQSSQVISMAEDFAVSVEDKGFRHLMTMIQTALTQKESEKKRVEQESVSKILENQTKYLCKRASLEAEIKILKSVLEMPTKYQEQADKLLNPPSSQRRKTSEVGG